MGAQLLKEASKKTNDDAGDGTTTSTVLAQAIIQEGFKIVAAGADPMAVKRGLERGMGTVRESIKDLSTPVAGREQIANVAVLSSHDDEMGNLIADVMDKVGKDGVITVDESKGLAYETEFVEGMQIDRGYISPYFVTNSDRMEAVLDNPLHPDHRQEGHGGRRHPSGARKGVADLQKPHRHRRGRGG